MPTIGASMQMLRPGEHTRAHRHTGSFLYQAAKGRGFSVIGGKRLYLLNDSGVLYSINKHTGDVHWKRRLGALAAASPAYAGGKVYVVLLQRRKKGPKSRVGRVVALDGKTGKIDWSKELASRSESSPLVAEGKLTEDAPLQTSILDLGEGVRARVRVSELMPLPGWDGFHVDAVAPEGQREEAL